MEYYLIKENIEIGSFSSFEDAINAWEEGCTIFNEDGAAIYPETKSELLTVLKVGDKGNKVKALQLLLIGYGFELQPFGADGNFNSTVEEKVKEFQSQSELDVTGIVDINTWNKLLGG